MMKRNWTFKNTGIPLILLTVAAALNEAPTWKYILLVLLLIIAWIVWDCDEGGFKIKD